MAGFPPSGAGRAGLQGRGRLEQRDRGRRSGAREKKGGALTGANPVDRRKKNSKLHLVCDAAGLPPAVLVTGANVHDIHGFKPLIEAIPPIRSRCGRRRRRPDKVRADKAYEAAELRRWLRQRCIASHIARKGVESKERLGRHRWKIERTVSWLLCATADWVCATSATATCSPPSSPSQPP